MDQDSGNVQYLISRINSFGKNRKDSLEDIHPA